MLTLILFIVFGSTMAYLAQDNLIPVTLHFGTYVISNVPLFYIIVGSLLVGLGLAYFTIVINSIFTSFSMRRKDNKISEGKSDIVDLTKRIHQLEIENAKLIGPTDENAL